MLTTLRTVAFLAALLVAHAAACAGASIRPQEQPPAAPKEKTGVPRAAVLSFGDRDGKANDLGLHITADHLRRCLPLLKEELGEDGTGVVVLHVNSRRGLHSEVQPIADLLHNEFSLRFRTVIWVDAAASAAAMSVSGVREIYFAPQGIFGPCNAFAGNNPHLIEEQMVMMEILSSRAGRNPLLTRAMQITQPLSATPDPQDPNGRTFVWFPDAESGTIIVNRPGNVLSLNADMALRIGFSLGTAPDLATLTTLMGYDELRWVGDRAENEPWPVCKAELLLRTLRKEAAETLDRFQSVYTRYLMALEASRAAPKDQRSVFVDRTEKALDSVKKLLEATPALRTYALQFTTDAQYRDWLKEQEAHLAALRP